MTDSDYEIQHQPSLAELIENARPIGDLSRFVIDDLSDDDEKAFFEILGNA